MNKAKLLMGMFLGLAAGMDLHIPKDPLKGIDLEREYKLIKQKKSKLSRRLRELVIDRVEGGSK